MKELVGVFLFILFLLLSASPVPAKTFYLSDGSTIEYKRVWKKGSQIFLLVNRDTLLEFSPEEVDQAKTLKAAGMKKFPRLTAKKVKPASSSAPAKRSKAAPPSSGSVKPAEAEDQSFVFDDSSESTPGTSAGRNVPAKATVNGKYSSLVQVMNCPKDQGSYGEFNDYGWWSGGPWCGQTGKAGYWVWVAPDWFVWSKKN